MAKKQTRRNVSVSPRVYARMVAYCELHQLPVSQLVERVVNAVIDGAPTEPGLRLVPRAVGPGDDASPTANTTAGHEPQLSSLRLASSEMPEPRYEPGPDDDDPRPLKLYLDDAIKRNGIPALGEEDSVPIQHAGMTRLPGELLHRIAQRVGTSAIDRDAAARKVARKPWAATARYLGVARGFHLFAYRETP